MLWRWHSKWVGIVVSGNGQRIVCGRWIYVWIWIVISMIVSSITIWWWRRWIFTLGRKHGIAWMRTVAIEISIIHKINWAAITLDRITTERRWTKWAHKIKTNGPTVEISSFGLRRIACSICILLRLFCTNALSTCCSRILIAIAIAKRKWGFFLFVLSNLFLFMFCIKICLLDFDLIKNWLNFGAMIRFDKMNYVN